MNYRELISALKVGHVETVYVFTGREAYLREDALTRLRKKVLPEGLADFNCTELTAPMTEDIIACAETLPMMADRRLIIVRDFTPLSGEEKKPTKLTIKVTELSSFVSFCSWILLFCFFLNGKHGKPSADAAIAAVAGNESQNVIRGIY